MNKPFEFNQGRPLASERAGVTVTKVGVHLGAEISGVDLRRKLPDEQFKALNDALGGTVEDLGFGGLGFFESAPQHLVGSPVDQEQRSAVAGQALHGRTGKGVGRDVFFGRGRGGDIFESLLEAFTDTIGEDQGGLGGVGDHAESGGFG